MPLEPPPSPWDFASAAEAALDGGLDGAGGAADDDLLAMGADLAPGTLLSAYRHGLFPMPGDPPSPRRRRREPAPLCWFSPQQRGVLPLDGLRTSRSLRRAVRDFDVRVDTATAAVIDGCADPTRPQGWIDADVRAAYLRLHQLGWVHSVEAWQGGELVGGLYGVAIGGLFAGESMFHTVRDASKVALVALVELLREGGHEGERLLDVQWSTPHLASLGVVEVDREDYLARLPAALALPLPPAFA